MSRCPLAPHLNEAELVKAIKTEPARGYIAKADQLAWVKRCQAGHAIDIACLRVGDARVLHMPGELFVEYQLAAKAMRPDLHVMMAAYGDYGPGYIGTAAAYAEGGYETSATASNVAPEVEPVLMDAMKQLLGEEALTSRSPARIANPFVPPFIAVRNHDSAGNRYDETALSRTRRSGSCSLVWRRSRVSPWHWPRDSSRRGRASTRSSPPKRPG